MVHAAKLSSRDIPTAGRQVAFAERCQFAGDRRLIQAPRTCRTSAYRLKARSRQSRLSAKASALVPAFQPLCRFVFPIVPLDEHTRHALHSGSFLVVHPRPTTGRAWRKRIARVAPTQHEVAHLALLHSAASVLYRGADFTIANTIGSDFNCVDRLVAAFDHR